MRKTVVLTLLALGFTIVSPAAAQGVILHLRNGDRLTGNIASEDSEKITLDTVWQTGLTVPLSLVEKREAAAKPTPAQSAPVVAEAAPEPPPTEPKISFWKRWNGELQVGLDIMRSEKDRDLWHGRTKLNYGKDRFRQSFDYSMAYGKTEGVLSANRMDGASKSDWDLSPKTFIYNLGTAGYDEIRKIDYQYEIGPGLGYRLITRTNFVLVVEGGGNYTETGFSTAPTRRELNLRLAEDITWSINSKMVFEEKFAYTPRIDEIGSYRLRFEGTLKYHLLGNVSLNMTVLDLFDSSPAPGVSKNDLQVRSALGVKF